jgi:DNA-binding response OmpR family regulator
MSPNMRLEAKMIKMLGNKNMLLLEDNEEFTQNAVAMFSVFVKNVFTAKTIVEARQTLLSAKIDIIFSDIHLKNENGLDFVTEVRQKDNDIPIVILSGHKDEALLFRAMTLNLSGYLLKPINFKELMDVLENCVIKLELNNKTAVVLKDDYTYDKNLKIVFRGEEIFELNKKEILFFEMLIQNTNRVITRDMFEAYIWEGEDMTDSALNNFVMRIRRRFGKQFLHTIPDVGYKMIV